MVLRKNLEMPKELPSQRAHNHKIPWLLNTPPINIKPYKTTSKLIKDAIELMVNELLEVGVIKDSQSLFSSSMVMVKEG